MSAAAVAAATCVAVGVLLVLGPAGRAAPALALPPRVVLALVAVVGATTALALVGPVRLLLLAVLVAVVAVERRRSSRRRRRLAVSLRCEDYTLALAAEMAAGRAPAEALAAACADDVPGSSAAARVAALGGDASVPLREGASAAGAGPLRNVAAAWHLASTTGAPLSDVLRRTSLLVREEVATVNEVDEQMAPVRATARVLAVLPAMGVVIGGGLGVNVPVLLLTTTWGQLCLLGALGLVSAGLWVIDRIGRRAAPA